jgi:hypothetical protein
VDGRRPLAGRGDARPRGRLPARAFIAEPRHDETVDRFEWVAANADRADLAKLFDLLAMPFLFGVVLVYVLLSRGRSPRLAYAGGILLGCGMVGLTAVQGYETFAFTAVQDGRFDVADLADAFDSLSPGAVAMLLLFLPGALFGLLTMTVALWRSQAVPRGAVALIPVFIVVDIFLQQGLVAHAVALVGACWIASAVLLAGHIAGTASASAPPAPAPDAA